MKTEPKPKQETILEEALRIVEGDRRESYGDERKSFARVASGWSHILDQNVTPQEVALCMMWLKMCREVNKSSRDNLVDVCGYAHLASKLVSPQS